jgi:hypothetical protein
VEYPSNFIEICSVPDDEIDTRSGLSTGGKDGEDGSAKISPSEKVKERHVVSEFLFDTRGLSDFVHFDQDILLGAFRSAEAPQCFQGFIVTALVCKPSRRFRDEDARN